MAKSALGRWILGCAQLGMAYGLTNRVGEPVGAAADQLIRTARSAGVSTFDTAQAYGVSETRLGQALRDASGEDLRIITKLAPTLDPTDTGAIRQAVQQSVCALGRTPWAILAHDPSWMDVWSGALGEALRDARKEGLCAHLGVSVYSPEEAFRAIQHEDVSIVQVPASAWDDVLTGLDFWAQARDAGTTVYVRSIYLQGLLRLRPKEAQSVLPQARGASEEWNRLADEWGCEPGILALRYALGFNVPLVIGCETPEQVLENSQLIESETPLDPDARSRIRSVMDPVLSSEVTDPRLWPRRT